MGRLKWIVYAVLAAGLATLLHYSLPSREIVRIVGSEVKREDTTRTGAGGEAVVETRDVRFIYAVTPQGVERVFRNEDTDWGWPPYFKFNTANVAAKAANAQSTQDNPRWVVVTQYGWRVEFFSWFPNIVDIRDAGAPDEPLWPWFNAVVLLGLLVAALLVRRAIIRFYERRVDPVVDAIDARLDGAAETMIDHYHGVSGWIRRLLGR